MSIDKATITAAFHMPPEEIVAFLRSKGLQVSDSWMDLWQTAHNRAFTVARSAGYDVLGDIRDALVKGMNEGLSYQQFTENLKPILQAKGWWGKAIDMETGDILQHESGSPVMLGSPRRCHPRKAQQYGFIIHTKQRCGFVFGFVTIRNKSTVKVGLLFDG